MHPHGNSAKLDLPCSLFCIHPIFNTSLFSLFQPRAPNLGPQQPAPPCPIFTDAQGPQYLIERIVAEKRVCGHPVYIVRWQDYDA
eukprot:448159-Rhodomonas_salina.1